MTVEEKVYSVLSANAALVALVPAAKIKVPGDWQNLTRPYIVHFPVSQQPIYTHEALQALRIWDFYQTSAVADSYSSGRAIADLIRSALTGVHGGVHCFLQSGPMYVGRNDETGCEEFALNWRIAEAL